MTKPPPSRPTAPPAGFARPAAKAMGEAKKAAPNGTKVATIKPMPPPSPPPPLTREELARIPAGASSTEALVKATGGTVERVGGVGENNAIVLNANNRRLIYIRPHGLGPDGKSAYKTGDLKKKLDPTGRFAARDLDHVASSSLEGKRMGMRWVLAAFVPVKVNQTHGWMVEKGPVPVREAAKAFQGGIEHDGKHHVTYLTQEMVDKLAGKSPTGRGHGTFRGTPSAADMKQIEQALMQDLATQRHLATLGAPHRAIAKQLSLPKSQAKGRSL